MLEDVNVQLQFEGMGDPRYLNEDLLRYLDSVQLGVRPEGDLSIAETFLWAGGKVYELFEADRSGKFEVYRSGFGDRELYVTNLRSKDNVFAEGIARAILEYIDGKLEKGAVYELAA